MAHPSASPSATMSSNSETLVAASSRYANHGNHERESQRGSPSHVHIHSHSHSSSPMRPSITPLSVTPAALSLHSRTSAPSSSSSNSSMISISMAKHSRSTPEVDTLGKAGAAAGMHSLLDTTITRHSVSANGIPSTTSSMHTKSTRSSSSTSTSSIVRAIDFAYLPGHGPLSSGRSSTSVSSVSSLSNASICSSSRRPSQYQYQHQPSLSRSSSSASASSSSCSTYENSTGTSSVSSRRTSSTAYSSSSSSSSSLASQFRNWALSTTSDSSSNALKPVNFSSSVSKKRNRNQNQLSLNTALPPSSDVSSSSMHLSISPAMSEECPVFSPLTDVPPLPPSVFPPGVSDEDDIEDVDGVVCFQPGW